MTGKNLAQTLTIKQRLNQMLKHSLVYGVTSSLQSVLGFVLLPILTNYYTPATFGVYSLILLISALAGVIFYLGASSALGRFYYEQDNPFYRKKIITTAFIITLSGCSLMVGLGAIFSGWLSARLFDTPDYARHIVLSLIATALGLLLNLMTLILRYENKSVVFFLTSIFGVLLNFTITYTLLIVYHYDILAPIYGLLAANAVCFLVLVFMISGSFTTALQKGHLATLFFFGLQASVSGLLFYILDWVDRLIIKDLLDLSQVGIYSLAYRIAAVINILYIVPFSLVWAPARMQNAKSENADTFVTKVNSYYTVAGLFIVFTAVIFGREAMAFFFHNKEYSNAAGIFPLIMLAQLVYGYQNILDYGIYIHKKIYFYIIISAVSIIVNIGLNFLFIPLWGNIAAAVVTLFTYILNSSLIYIISNRYHRIHIEWGRVFWPLALVISSYGLLYFVDQLPDLNRYLIKSFLVLTTIVLFYKLWLDEKERFYLRHIGKRL